MSGVHMSSRRMFLSASGFSVAIPFLSSLLPRSVLAQTKRPRRFVAFRTGHGGIWEENLLPSASTLTERETLLPGHEVSWGRLKREVSGGRAVVSKVLSAPDSLFSERLLGKMNLLRGLDVSFYLAHNTGGVLGTYNSASGPLPAELTVPTIDQIMAASPGVYPSGVSMRARSIYTGTAGSQCSFRYKDPKNPSAGIEGAPWVDYALSTLPKMLFTNQTPTSASNNGPDRKLIVDAALADYKRLRQSATRLSAADRARLDQHMERLYDVQKRAEMYKPVTCTDPKVDDNPGWGDLPYFQAMNDIIAAAFACDVTRVFSINCASETFDKVHAGDWHTVAHEAGDSEAQQNVLWAANQKMFELVVLDLARKLDSASADGVNTLLDDSLVLWGQECATPSHHSVDFEVVTMGGAGGAIKTGMYVDYRNKIPMCASSGGEARKAFPNWLGVPHSRFLATALGAMGVSRQEWQRPDGPGYPNMPFDSKFMGASRYVAGELAAASEPLPIIT